jgi:hypothetical protein
VARAGDDAFGVVGDAPSSAVGIRDAHEIGVQADEETLGGESHSWAPRADRGLPTTAEMGFL